MSAELKKGRNPGCSACRVMRPSANAGTVAAVLGESSRAVHVQGVGARRDGAAVEHDALFALDPAHVAEAHDVLDPCAAARARPRLPLRPGTWSASRARRCAAPARSPRGAQRGRRSRLPVRQPRSAATGLRRPCRPDRRPGRTRFSSQISRGRGCPGGCPGARRRSRAATGRRRSRSCRRRRSRSARRVRRGAPGSPTGTQRTPGATSNGGGVVAGTLPSREVASTMLLLGFTSYASPERRDTKRPPPA